MGPILGCTLPRESQSEWSKIAWQTKLSGYLNFQTQIQKAIKITTIITSAAVIIALHLLRSCIIFQTKMGLI